jgi:hypothetical protein
MYELFPLPQFEYRKLYYLLLKRTLKGLSHEIEVD